jgi:hypothetical protein
MMTLSGVARVALWRARGHAARCQALAVHSAAQHGAQRAAFASICLHVSVRTAIATRHACDATKANDRSSAGHEKEYGEITGTAARIAHSGANGARSFARGVRRGFQGDGVQTASHKEEQRVIST